MTAVTEEKLEDSSGGSVTADKTLHSLCNLIESAVPNLVELSYLFEFTDYSLLDEFSSWT